MSEAGFPAAANQGSDHEFSDRRSAPRLTTDLAGVVTTGDGARHDVHVTDLSAAGLRFRSHRPLSTVVDIRLKVDGAEAKPALRLAVEPAWTLRTRDGIVTGVRFRGMDRDLKRRLEAVLRCCTPGDARSADAERAKVGRWL